MSTPQFFTHLGITILITALALLGLSAIPQIAPYQLFGWLSLMGFVLLTIMMFFAGSKAAASENKNNFTSTVLGFTMGKMFLSIIIIFAYQQLALPADKFFIAPFFTVYFLFTAFETYFMMKLGRTGI